MQLYLNFNMFLLNRNGQLCIWECSIEPSDLVVYRPPTKRVKASSDSEDDVDLDKVLEKTEKEKLNSEKKLLEDVENIEKNEKRVTRSKDRLDNKDVKKLTYKRLKKHYLSDEVHKNDKDAVLTTAAYHKDTHILVVGFSNGSFFLYEMPEVNTIHSLR